MANFEVRIYSIPKELCKDYGMIPYYPDFLNLAEEHGEVQTLHHLMKTGKLLPNAVHHVFLVNKNNPEEIIKVDDEEVILSVNRVTVTNTIEWLNLDTGEKENSTGTYTIYGKGTKSAPKIL